MSERGGRRDGAEYRGGAGLSTVVGQVGQGGVEHTEHRGSAEYRGGAGRGEAMWDKSRHKCRSPLVSLEDASRHDDGIHDGGEARPSEHDVGCGLSPEQE